jgi:hemerythrin-like domain-containing protein
MATKTMSMNKVIHCAVRRDLRRFRSALDAFQDGDRARAAALHTAWVNFDHQLTEHHEGEHEIAWPAMKTIGVSDHSITTFDEQHEAMASALRAAGAAMDTLARTATAADAQSAGTAMAALDEATTTHLDHEEQEIEQLLLTKEEEPAIKQMSKQFSKRSSVPVAGTFFAWMDDGATAAERAALRQSVPAPVIAVIGGVFGRRYRKQVASVWAAPGSS